MKIYFTTPGIVIEHENAWYSYSDSPLHELINRPSLYDFLSKEIKGKEPSPKAESWISEQLLAPIDKQEVWASGVTYFRSREARMEESKDTGGGDFYDKVYDADRPELFFKSTPYRVATPGGPVNIRRDSSWNVPEPELTLVINKAGDIVGYTLGNDMSSRDIEGENPLYLPQAKSYDLSAAVGPCIWVSPVPISGKSVIRLEILRGGTTIFADAIELKKMKRGHQELVSYLYRECSFPYGCMLMTGTGIVPPNEFTLQKDDEIRISMEEIGTLVNFVDMRS